MKNTRAHFLSSIIGGAIVAGFLLVLGMAQSTYTISPVGGPMRVEGIPAPDQLIRIKEGDTFTVPDDKVLVVTGVIAQAEDPQFAGVGFLGATNIWYKCFVDGQGAFGGLFGFLSNFDASNSFTDVLSPGYKIHAGATVTVDDAQDGNPESPAVTLLGYLADV